MRIEARDSEAAAAYVASELEPALVVEPGTTVATLRRQLLEPGGVTSVVVVDGDDHHLVDALWALRTELPESDSALLLRCCQPQLLSVDDDLGTIAFAALDRPAEHRGHDLLFATDGGLRTLSTAVLTALLADRAVAAAQVDALTRLPDRGAITATLEDALRSERRRVAVAFIDLDRFKEINDLHGHAAGDRVLEVVGKRLAEGLRPGDAVGRIGGDEFLAVLDVGDMAEARAATERLVQRIGDPIEQTTAVVRVGVSAGVTLAANAPGLDATHMIADADALMFLAKQRGGGVLVAGEEGESVVTRSQLQSAIDGDVLQLQYQPIIPLDGSPPEAVEALVRWPQPDGGSLRPGAFIPLAEATGQIIELDWWALHTAIRHLASWDESAGSISPRRVHVNLSALTLAIPGLVSHVEQLLAMSGIAPERITLELTESSVVADSERAANVLTALAELGVGTAIDDFGVGSSSLAQLSELPVSALKIDRAFVRRMTTREVDRGVVRVIQALADELGLDVVAEGVESLEQAEVLRELGVTHAQGWLWSHALDAWTVPSDLWAVQPDAGPGPTVVTGAAAEEPSTFEVAADDARMDDARTGDAEPIEAAVPSPPAPPARPPQDRPTEPEEPELPPLPRRRPGATERQTTSTFEFWTEPSNT